MTKIQQIWALEALKKVCDKRFNEAIEEMEEARKADQRTRKYICKGKRIAYSDMLTLIEGLKAGYDQD